MSLLLLCYLYVVCILFFIYFFVCLLVYCFFSFFFFFVARCGCNHLFMCVTQSKKKGKNHWKNDKTSIVPACIFMVHLSFVRALGTPPAKKKFHEKDDNFVIIHFHPSHRFGHIYVEFAVCSQSHCQEAYKTKSTGCKQQHKAQGKTHAHTFTQMATIRFVRKKKQTVTKTILAYVRYPEEDSGEKERSLVVSLFRFVELKSFF